ncbi:MAG: aldo/keto reductase [Dehalococcoidales bacterium]
MEYRNLGSTGLKVSQVSLGANNFGWFADEESSIKVINYALEVGINFIDTADIYDHGNSETFIGKALKGKRDKVLIATKSSGPMGDGPNDRGSSRYYMMRAVEASLKRLQTDYIDFYQMHFPDPQTPIEETLRALDDLVHSGKVRYIGCSNYAAWQLSDALWTSRTHNLHSFATNQVRYNLLDRAIESELVPCCVAHDVGIIPWFPLSAGFLTGKYRKGEERPADGRLSGPSPAGPPGNRAYDIFFTDSNFEKLAVWESFAKKHGHSMVELAIAWLLSKPYVSTVIAGARKVEQLKDNIAAVDWKLSAADIAEFEAAEKGIKG